MSNKTAKPQRSFYRKFGKVEVYIEAHEKSDGLHYAVSAVGDILSNYGHLYPHDFARFRAWHKQAAPLWPEPQVVGMEDPLSPAISKWIKGLILSGRI